MHQTTVPYSPQQNGVAERTNRTLTEKIRCMLSESRLDKRFWAEAMNIAIYLKNRFPTDAVKDAVPEEIWSKIDISNLKIFGCRVQVYVPKRQQLDKKSNEMIFVGYSEETKEYRLIDKNNPKQINIARSVVFIETDMANLTDYILQDGTIDDNLAMDNIVIDQYNEVQNESVNESENSEESDPNIVLYNESELESQNSESSSNDDYVSLSDDDN